MSWSQDSRSNLTILNPITANRLAAILFSLMCTCFAGQRATASAGDGALKSTEVSGQIWAGYQSWFSAGPTDPNGIGNWFHLAKDQSRPPSVGNFNVELWPDMSFYPEQSRIRVAAHQTDGQPLEIFSSGDSEVIKIHLELMRSANIAGPFVQRFLSDIKDPGLKVWKNQTLARIRSAAAISNRAFAVMYDLSGVSNSLIEQILIPDINDLVLAGVFHDANCMTREGKPLIAMWGLGFNDRDLDPTLIASIISQLHQRGFAVMGGVPFYYGRGGGDVSTDARWKAVFETLDVVSPWAVGRYQNLGELQNFSTQIKLDIQHSAQIGQVYMPVIFAGFSWTNLTTGKFPSNQIPRAGGQFFWDQARLYSQFGVKTIYVAMFDELDEGTAIMPLIAKKSLLPLGSNLLSADQDGFDLPSDFYLRLVGVIADRQAHGRALEAKVPYTLLR